MGQYMTVYKPGNLVYGLYMGCLFWYTDWYTAVYALYMGQTFWYIGRYIGSERKIRGGLMFLG
jgi:hypothetical protein